MSKINPSQLKSARKAKKLTIKQLHELSGISIGQLSEAENGKTTLGGDKLISVCRILGIPLFKSEQHASPMVHKIIVVVEQLDDEGAEEVLRVAERELKRVRAERTIEDQKPIQDKLMTTVVEVTQENEELKKEDRGEVLAEGPKERQVVENETTTNGIITSPKKELR